MMKLLTGSLFCLISLILASHVLAEEYYVSPYGDDANAGTSVYAPKQTLDLAIYALGLGDTLTILPGTYDVVDFQAWPNDQWKGKMFLNTDGGDANNRVTITGQRGSAKPVINVWDATGTNPGKLEFKGVVGLNLEYLKINHGIVGYGSDITYKDLEIYGPGVDYAIHSEHHRALIEDCYIHDIYGGTDAIGIYITGTDNIIRNNFFKNMGQHAINTNSWDGNPSTGWLIENNKITQTSGHGVGLQNIQNTIIRNNVIVNAGSQSISVGGTAFDDENVSIVNNTIYSQAGLYGIFAYNPAPGLVVENNIVHHPTPVAWSGAGEATQAILSSQTWRNNIYYNPVNTGRIFLPDNDQGNGFSLSEWQAYTSVTLGVANVETNSQEAAPEVTSAPSSGSDYLNYDGSGVDVSLPANSIAVDTGIISSYVYKDIIGTWRPQGSSMDVGAYEVIQSTGDITPPTQPTGLTSVTPTDGTVYNPLYNIARLTWSASTDNVAVVGYNIYRDSVLIASTGELTFDDKGLTAETSYAYQVAAIDAEGNESSLSAEVTHTVPTTPPQNEPPNPKFTLSYDETDNSTGVDFNPSTSSATEGSLIKTFYWDFGDGTSQTVNVDLTGLDPAVDAQPTIAHVYHTYPVLGYFPVTLTVTDTYNRTASVTWNVRYKYSNPVTYYVSPNGSDLNDGLSASSPLKDLTNAVYRLYNGCTLIVMDGTYYLDDFKAWPNDQYKLQMYLDQNGGDVNNHVTIKGASGVLPKIIARKSGSVGGHFEFAGIVGLEMSNLSIHGEVGYGTSLHLHDLEIMGPINDYGIHGVLTNSIIENCYIHDIYGGSDAHGMYVTGDNITIRHNFFKRIGVSAIHTNSHDGGIPSKNYLIEGNYMTDVGAHGVSIFNVQDSLIRNNVLVNVHGQVLSIGGSACANTGDKFIGNTVVNGGTDGFTGVFISNPDTTGLIFKNNIIIHNRPFGFSSVGQPDSTMLASYDFSNNIFYNYNDTWSHFIDGGANWTLSEWQSYSGTESSSVQQNPLLVSTPTTSSEYLQADGSDNFNLMPTSSSVARGMGIPDSDLTVDIDGVTRTTVDVGAYQYTGTSPIPLDVPINVVGAGLLKPLPPSSLKLD